MAKKFVKGKKLVFGVCSGIADYFDWDPTLVRLGFVAATCLYGFGLIVYITAAIITPED